MAKLSVFALVSLFLLAMAVPMTAQADCSDGHGLKTVDSQTLDQSLADGTAPAPTQQPGG